MRSGGPNIHEGDTWRQALRGWPISMKMYICVRIGLVNPPFTQSSTSSSNIWHQLEQPIVSRVQTPHERSCVFRGALTIAPAVGQRPRPATRHFSFHSLLRRCLFATRLCRGKGVDRGVLVQQNIERFLRIRDELQLEWPKATLAFVVQPENAHEAQDFLNHWKPLLRDPARPVGLAQ